MRWWRRRPGDGRSITERLAELPGKLLLIVNVAAVCRAGSARVQVTPEGWRLVRVEVTPEY